MIVTQPIAKLARGWLKAGIVDQGQTLFPETGVPQGGVISPLLMNVAFHGLEEDLLTAYPKRHKPAVIRFADDMVRHEARYVHGARAPTANRRAVSLSRDQLIPSPLI